MSSKNEDEKTDNSISRRDFLRFAWGSAAKHAREKLADTVEDLDSSLGVARPRFSSTIYVGTVNDLNDHNENDVIDAFVSENHFFLVRTQFGWLALYDRCTYQSCSLTTVKSANIDRQISPSFQCTIDESQYDVYGAPISGPASYPMDLLDINIRGDKVYVMTDSVIARSDIDLENDSVEVS